MRREILRQAVAENLAEATGGETRRRQPPQATHRRRETVATRTTRRRIAWGALVAVLAIGVGTWALLGPPAIDGASPAAQTAATSSSTSEGTGGEGGSEAGFGAAQANASGATAADPAAQGLPGSGGTATGPDFTELRFAAPRPIDPAVFPLEVKRVVIDPGHGGGDTGTAEHGLLEKELTLDIAERLREYLVEDGFEVEMTREGDTFLDLRERALLANELRADLFVSIHINWIPRIGAGGVETYYLGAAEDPLLEELARRENRDSGYSLADMQELLESIYTDVRQDASRRLAERVQRSLYTALRRENPELVDRGVKSAPFVVLVATRMPAILAEVSSLSDRGEAELLEKPLYRDHIARALSRGVRKYADEVHQTETKGS